MILLADDAMARIDAPHFAAAQGHEVLGVTMEGEVLHIVVRKGRLTSSPV